ncbi:MAG: hypothetical protein IPH46_17830 [Bacteroidetes bacterium]|nr:hypothetical protein [Bacteroidota bacterium]
MRVLVKNRSIKVARFSTNIELILLSKFLRLNTLTVKSVYRPKEVAFLIEWNDSSKATKLMCGKFCEPVRSGISFKYKSNSSSMMGNKEACCCCSLESHLAGRIAKKVFQDVQSEVSKYVWVDVYPGLESYLDRSKRIYAQDITAVQIVDTRSTGNILGDIF